MRTEKKYPCMWWLVLLLQPWLTPQQGLNSWLSLAFSLSRVTCFDWWFYNVIRQPCIWSLSLFEQKGRWNVASHWSCSWCRNLDVACQKCIQWVLCHILDLKGCSCALLRPPCTSCNDPPITFQTITALFLLQPFTLLLPNSSYNLSHYYRPIQSISTLWYD